MGVGDCENIEVGGNGVVVVVLTTGVRGGVTISCVAVAVGPLHAVSVNNSVKDNLIKESLKT